MLRTATAAVSRTPIAYARDDQSNMPGSGRVQSIDIVARRGDVADGELTMSASIPVFPPVAPFPAFSLRAGSRTL